MSTFKATFTASKKSSRDLDEQDLSLDELTELLTTPIVGDKDGVAIIPALFRPCPAVCWRKGTETACDGNGPHRMKWNVSAMTGFGADIDDVTADSITATVQRLQALGIFFILWATYSHDPEAVERGEAAGRYRILVPFKEPLPITSPEQWSRGAWPRLMRHFGLETPADVGNDTSWKDPCRLFFLPRHPEGAVREAMASPGALFDARAVVGDLDTLIPVSAPPTPRPSSETEDPSRPVDVDALKARLVDTHNATTKALAQRVVRGEMLTALPGQRQAGEMSRHEAWWLITGRLSIVAEEWMSTEALLSILRPSHTAEREASPADFTPWDDDRDSVCWMLDAQRSTAPTRRAQYQAEREAKSAVVREAFNNLLARRGKPTLPAQPEGNDDEDLAPAPATSPEEVAEAEETWSVDEVKANLEVRHSPTGMPVYPGTLQNVSLVLGRAPEWRGAFRLNKLTGAFEVWPCEALGGDEPETFSDTLITTLRLTLALNSNYPMKAGKDEVVASAEWVAQQNAYEPVVQYLRSVKWDGVSRLDSWLEQYLNARTETDEKIDLRPYLSAIGKRWLISGVARALQPGCQADSMLQIEGAQGLKKSSALKVLGGDWYTESTSDFESKDTAVILCASWIVELGELASFDRASEAAQKSFLARRVDSIVRKYERYRSDLPRRCIFAGTVNPTDGYLTDTTGNRRHWTFSVERVIDLERLKRDRDQLWAEAVVLYEAGEQWHLTPEEEEVAKAEAAKRVRGELIDELIEEWITRTRPDRRPRGILPADVVREVYDNKPGALRKSHITAALRRLGFENKVMRFGKVCKKRWATPARLLDAGFDSAANRAEVVDSVSKAHPEAKA